MPGLLQARICAWPRHRAGPKGSQGTACIVHARAAVLYIASRPLLNLGRQCYVEGCTPCGGGRSACRAGTCLLLSGKVPARLVCVPAGLVCSRGEAGRGSREAQERGGSRRRGHESAAHGRPDCAGAVSHAGPPPAPCSLSHPATGHAAPALCRQQVHTHESMP